ncbi:hypothetical protein ACLIYP_14660 [Streptomyces nanhaiensis]|uniref:hypothetical protein n=1 Tax=Streptomyces nanhaiensis TaxID=679319 RepID=UPI00399D1EDE
MLRLLAAGAAVTLTVWAVSMIRPVRWRALVYSLPLPMTVVLLTTGVRVDSGQLLGVTALYAFFGVTAVLHARCGWHILAADAAGVIAYLLLSRAFTLLPVLPFVPVLIAVCTLWLAVTAMLPPRTDRPAGPAPPRPRALVKLGTAASGALLMVGAGRFLKGLVVTFPYSGILTAIESRHDLGNFTRHFVRNSVCLFAFFTAGHLVQDHGRAAAIAAGWLAHLLCAAGLHLRPRLRRAPRPA